MATKVRFKLVNMLWISTILCCGILVQCRPKTENSFIEQDSDPSDRTLIRVLRSEFEEEEQEQASLGDKAKKIPKVKEPVPRIQKRASEEDQFFQALLSRANDKPVEKRSYDSQPEKDDVRMNWKGDSKISDADKHELEHLFNSIGMVDDGEKDLKRKVDAKRATKTSVDGKVQDLVEWLMAKPPKEFHDSLRHIIDVEHEVSDIFSPDEQTVGQTTSNTATNDDASMKTTMGTETATETTSPVTTTSAYSTSTPASASSPVSVASPASATTSVVSTSPLQTNLAQGQVTSYTSTSPQTAMQVPPSNAAAGSSAEVSTQPQAQELKDAKRPDIYADVTKASHMLAKTGPGPIPSEALDYFNKFSGGVESLSPQALTNYGVHPPAPAASPALPAYQQVPAVQQPAVQQPAVQQPAAMTVSSQSPAPYPQPAYPQTSAGYANQYQNNPYYAQYDQRQAAAYPRPQRGRNTGYQPPPPKPYPLNRDELDKPTGKKKSVTASILFKQNWSSDFKKSKSTRYRVFKTEAKRELRRVFELNTKFKEIAINKIREDRGKVGVTFTVVFKKDTERPLEALYNQIARDYLGSMPVYRDTLTRGDDPRAKAPKSKNQDGEHSKTEKSQSDNPATEFARFVDKVDKQRVGENLPLNEKHEAYQGCFKDRKPNRDMRKHFSKFEMTPEWCVHTCKKEGFRFAGVQYSYLCFCGNKFGKYGRVRDSECSSRCYGDRNRFCGSFWHNSVYSVDGQHHDPDEFAAVQDDEPDKAEPNEEDDKKKVTNKDEEKEHAEVANHLMQAASSALKAAKKLLPGKNKRQTEEELIHSKKEAQKALKVVDDLVQNKKTVEKRTTESSDGRNLLMAYLGDVGGYDREYRSAEDEDKPVEKLKFDYKRMIIDETGDGEFVAKPRVEKPIGRSRRSLETEEFDGRKKMALRAVDDGSDPTNPKAAVAEPSRRELLSKDTSDKEIKRRSRDTDEEEQEEEEEMERNKKSKSRKRSVGIDKSLYHVKVQEGLENVIGGLIDVMKGTSSIALFKGLVERLATDVANGLAIPPEQKDQVSSEIRQDIKETATARVNSLVTSIRTELNEYGEMHPAVGPQAGEAAKSISDIPLDGTKAEEIKNKIRKRSLDEAEEVNANRENAFLSDILKQHFKLNP